MARTDTLPHFLTDVADAIREKKGSEDTIKASNFDTEIENLPSGGASLPSIDGQAIKFKELSGTTSGSAYVINSTDTTVNNKAYRYPTPKKALCFAYVRDTYTYTGTNITFIGESGPTNFDGARQNIMAIWTERQDGSTPVSVTQSRADRMGFITVIVKNAKAPTSTNKIFSEVINTPQSSITVNPTKNLCFYAITPVYALGSNYASTDATGDFIYAFNTDRLALFISNNDKQKTIPLPTNSGCAIIGIELEYEAE